MLAEVIRFEHPLEAQPLVALVGADTAGKSTLAHELTRLGVQFVYRGGPTRNVFEGLEKAEACLKNLPASSAPYFLCEHINNVDAIVYAPIFGYTPTVGEMAAVRAFEERWKHKLILVYCVAPLEALEERLRKRGDPFVAVSDLPLILERYQERLANTVLNCISVDTFNSTPTESACALDTVLKELISACTSRSSRRSLS